MATSLPFIGFPKSKRPSQTILNSSMTALLKERLFGESCWMCCYLGPTLGEGSEQERRETVVHFIATFHGFPLSAGQSSSVSQTD